MTVWQWVSDNYIEILGAFSGFLYLGFSIKQHFLTWPTGLLNALFYIFIFFSSGLYADMTLQFYYVFVSVYGWWCWVHKTSEGATLAVSHASNFYWSKIMIISCLLFFLIYYLLIRFTNSQVPILDGLTTALSITATWMLAQKKIEHWLVWLLVDFISIGLFLYKGLYPTALLFLAYTLLAVYGYLTWGKELKSAKSYV